MEKPIRLFVKGYPESLIIEILKAETIRHIKTELEAIEILVTIETLKDWENTIIKIIKRYDIEPCR